MAVYIHQQINGTFDDIFEKLYELVDLLELPNRGSITIVTNNDAYVIIEEIGACPKDFNAFLAEDGVAAKSVALIEEAKSCGAGYGRRHPRFSGPAEDSEHVHSISNGDLSTKEWLSTIKREAIGIWYQETSKGKIMFYSRFGRMPVGIKHIKKHPVDSELNVWIRTHMSPGWKACGGLWCAGESPPAWVNTDEEEPPFSVPELRKQGCIGFCHRARKEEIKRAVDT